MMVRDMGEMFGARGGDGIASAEIIAEQGFLEDRPWMEYRHGKPITAQTVASLMKPFGIRATVKKWNGASTRVYLRTDVDAAAARYVTSSRNPVTSQQYQPDTQFWRRNSDAEVTPENPDNPLKINDGYEVTPEASPPRGFDDNNPDTWL